MRYLVLATDYDGTLAYYGRVLAETITALERIRMSGRQLFLVTGRQLEDLQHVFPRLDLFDYVIAENGALLYRPSDQYEQVLTEPPSAALIDALQARNVAPMAVGRSIIATWEPHEVTILSTIRELGLELQVTFNKGAVMVLPSGVNKASGLQAALAAANLSIHNVVGIGDAENDHAFLNVCECGVAVANALPILKQRADWVTNADHGAGVEELIEALLSDDLLSRDQRLQRHWLLVGTAADGTEQRMSPYATNLLLCGSSGSGKSTLATALLDQLTSSGYQVVITDPEGDYDSYPHATVLGSPDREPTVDEILSLLANPQQSVVINLLGITLARRPAFLDSLLPRLEALRAKTGRPHWIVVDEAHHMLHTERAPGSFPLAAKPWGMLYITVHPELVAPTVLQTIDHVAVVGEVPDTVFQAFCDIVGDAVPQAIPHSIHSGEVIWWRRGTTRPLHLQAVKPTSEHQRHIRKYAEGDMEETSFFFRGPEDTLKLGAKNLLVFLELADGIDDQTWMFHLTNGDYTEWFRGAVKDADLAAEAQQIAEDSSLNPRESRARIRNAIERRYTAPAM